MYNTKSVTIQTLFIISKEVNTIKIS